MKGTVASICSVAVRPPGSERGVLGGVVRSLPIVTWACAAGASVSAASAQATMRTPLIGCTVAESGGAACRLVRTLLVANVNCRR